MTVKFLLEQRTALQTQINAIDAHLLRSYNWRQFADAGHTVYAVKAYMYEHACSLQTAKDAVDDYCKS